MKNLSCLAIRYVIFISFTALFSCEKGFDFTQIQLHNDSIEETDVFLNFKDIDTYNSKVKELKNLSIDEIDAWEKSLNFMSMRRFYQTAISEDKRFLQTLKNESIGKLNEKNREVLHADFVLRNAKYFSFDQSNRYFFGMNSPTNDTIINSLINKNGIVKIGNFLIQYTKDYTKVLKLKESYTKKDIIKLKSATKTSLAEYLYVSPTWEGPVRKKSDNTARVSFNEECEFNKDGLNSKMQVWTVYYNSPEFVYNPQTDELVLSGWVTYGELRVRVYLWNFWGSVYSSTWKIKGSYDLNCNSGYTYLGCQNKLRSGGANGEYSSGGTATLEVVKGSYIKPNQYDYFEYTLQGFLIKTISIHLPTII